MHWPGRQPTLRSLHALDRAKAIAFCERNPVDSVLVRVGIEKTGIGASRVIGQFDAGRKLTALAWDHGNIIPLGFDEDGLDDLAEAILERWTPGSSIVGPADQVLGLWRRLEGRRGPAREVRERQFSMVMDSDPDVAADPLVRPALPEEVPLVFPASVAMYIEEVGYDPTSYGAGYALRVAGLVHSGHTFVKLGPTLDGTAERVVFKADIGALAGGVAQLQGVWVAPDLRGRGMATTGVAAVVRHIRESIAPIVSLYVNDFNVAAVAAYERVGFRVDGQWATVLI